jgi:hypothetical protein
MKKWILLFLVLLAIIAAPVIFTSSRKPSLILQAAGIFISTIIAISAIWGEHIRASFAGPKLLLNLKNDEGDLTRITGGPDARYYHLRVVNKRSAAIARNTRVQIISIQRYISGAWSAKQETYGVEPKWVFSSSSPKNIGPDALCDILSIVDGGDCVLSSYIYPNNVNLFIKAGEIARIKAVAVAENTKSKVLTLEISWDGLWFKDGLQMKEHLKLKEL